MTSIKFRALNNDEHKLFFEALGEYGKDFQSIQQYMTLKGAKSTAGSNNSSNNNVNNNPSSSCTNASPSTVSTNGNVNNSGNNLNQSCNNLNNNNTKLTAINNVDQQEKRDEDRKREQIRNFYNKLYAKLSQLVGKLDDRVDKVNQELYLLINYGEIWKKHGFKSNNKTKTKKLLEELVYQGYTITRLKNKNVRLRTPPCKALKKINEIGVDEKVKVVTTRELPKDVILEFVPSTNSDWLRVQSLSQNPRVRARLSIQKRVLCVLNFLEAKWNVTQDKLVKNVDTWLKVPSSGQVFEDVSTNQTGTVADIANSKCNDISSNRSTEESSASSNSQRNKSITHVRLRPSSQHELKEVNITRVVPDNHLDLSLNAYIRRLEESKSKNLTSENDMSMTKLKIEAKANNSTNKDSTFNSSLNDDNHMELSHGALSTSSKLPLSLTTPDSSILLERSCTSDQPNIVQTRRHLNLLQSLATSFEGCENSRIACEDTQASLLSTPIPNQLDVPSSVNESSGHRVTFSNHIPALFDENAAIDSTLPSQTSINATNIQETVKGDTRNLDHNSQASKSNDFSIPKNVTLGDWFKMTGNGDDANDAFSLKDRMRKDDSPSIDANKNDKSIIQGEAEARLITQQKNDLEETKKRGEHIDNIASGEQQSEASASGIVLAISNKAQDHMIDIDKLAEGWIKQDEPAMTVGELYLALGCPEKIMLEYKFENNFTGAECDEQSRRGSINKCQDSLSDTESGGLNSSLINKLLTAASLSLAQLERQKQEQQHKLHDQQQQAQQHNNHQQSKLKRRKGPSNPNTIKFLRQNEPFAQAIIAANNNNPNQNNATGSAGNIVVVRAGQPISSQGNKRISDNNSYILSANGQVAAIATANGSVMADKYHPSQTMTMHDIEATNQRVEEALKQLQPTRLSVFRRAR